MAFLYMMVSLIRRQSEQTSRKSEEVKPCEDPGREYFRQEKQQAQRPGMIQEQQGTQ